MEGLVPCQGTSLEGSTDYSVCIAVTTSLAMFLVLLLS